MYFDSWNFGYKREKVPFEKKVVDCLSSNRHLNVRSEVQIELLEKYSGIRFDWKGSSYPYKELELLRSSINDSILIIHMDGFWCPWMPIYGKVHVDHYCLLTSMTSSHLSCLDPFHGDGKYCLNYSDYLQGVKGTAFLSCLSNYEVPDWKKLLIESIGRVGLDKQDKSDFDYMDDFISDIFRYESLNEFIEQNRDIDSSTLLLRLTQIANGRKKYSLILKIISEKVGERNIECFSSEFSEISGRWEHVRNLVIKMYLGNCCKSDVDYVVDKLKLAKEKELMLLHNMIGTLVE